MSAALQSLMPESPPARPTRGLASGAVAFVGIGAGAAGSFIVISSVLAGLDQTLPDWVINAACYGAMIVPVYLLHRRYSFASDAPHARALPRYMAVQAVALLLATLFAYLIDGYLAVPSLLASVLVIGLTSGVNYLVLRSWAFARGQLGAPVTA